uniref:Protein SCAI n=1 Tax=Plectus sambesii TaxID=2011161 RepID=A0A914WM33_9BILA
MDNTALTDQQRRVIQDFTTLLDKSKTLFNGIRDLPQHGTKQWQAHFGRTFDVFTRLWKFQQQHRQILDTHYGLKRWQIGEIASKIGQLYYHYYLRTSETGYLLETFSFYSAIRARAYYSQATKEDKPDLMVKKLRYYARFIVVCLLLKKLKLVRDMVRELSRHVEEYIQSFDPEDQLEWTLILTEIKSFVEVSCIPLILHRLTPYNTPPIEPGIPFCCTLQEVIIVGNCADQVKCTEMSLDMFWMLQALEREPHDEAPGGGDDSFSRVAGKENPHKYLLYKPTFSQFMLFVSAGYKELPSGGALLLYISADGVFTDIQKRAGGQAYDFGGVAMNNRRDMSNSTGSNPSLLLNNMHQRKSTAGPPSTRDVNCLYPGDLYPLLRRPTFLIVDSENSSVFLGMRSLFGQPLVTFTGPVDVPTYLRDQPKRGSLMTLFLHSPLTAICYICNISEVSISLWDKCQAHVDKFICDAGRLLVRCGHLDRSYLDFYLDDFLRLLMLRFIFCSCTLRLHRNFKMNPAFQPHCHPPIPEDEVLTHPSLKRLVYDLACILDVMHAFHDDDETVC